MQTYRFPVLVMVGGLLLTVAACESPQSTQPKMGTAPMAAMPADGGVPLPAEYKSWPKFLSYVQKPDNKQVREVYINPTGAKTMQGQNFPNGTAMVMEIYKAKTDGDQLVKDMDGKLIKGDLAKVFVMGKNEGWGQGVPDNLKNGSWLYAAYGPDGAKLMEDFGECRACHQPQFKKDFVHKYDEYFQTRGTM